MKTLVWVEHDGTTVKDATLAVVTAASQLGEVHLLVAGQGVDSLIFYPLAFLGTWKTSLVISVLVTNYLLKVLWEVILTPVTYQVVAFFKRAEGLDVFDTKTDFTPFTTKV